MLVLTRARNTRQAVLHVTGRDVEEAEYPLELDAALGLWRLLDGPASDLGETDQRRRILAVLREKEGIGPKAIADASRLSHDVVRQLVRRMVDDGTLDTDGQGHYFAPGHTVHTVHTDGTDQEEDQ